METQRLVTRPCRLNLEHLTLVDSGLGVSVGLWGLYPGSVPSLTDLPHAPGTRLRRESALMQIEPPISAYLPRGEIEAGLEKLVGCRRTGQSPRPRNSPSNGSRFVPNRAPNDVIRPD